MLEGCWERRIKSSKEYVVGECDADREMIKQPVLLKKF